VTVIEPPGHVGPPEGGRIADALLLQESQRRHADTGQWYRRRGFVVSAVAVAVLAVAVITDLPAPASRSSDVAAATTVVHEVNADVSGCGYAVQEAAAILAAAQNGTLSAADRAGAPKLLADDQVACSVASASVFDLSNIDIPNGAFGKRLAAMVDTVTIWATGDALGVIETTQYLMAHPHDARALAALAKYRVSLASDRSLAVSSLGQVASDLSTRLAGLQLPSLPASGSGPLTP